MKKTKTTEEIEREVISFKKQKEKYINSIDLESKVSDTDNMEGYSTLTEAIILLENLDSKKNKRNNPFRKFLKKIPLMDKITDETRKTIIENKSLKESIIDLSNNLEEDVVKLREKEHSLNKDLILLKEENVLLENLKKDSIQKYKEIESNQEKENSKDLDELFILKKSIRDVETLLFFNQNAIDSKKKNIVVSEALIKNYEMNGETIIGSLVQHLKNATDSQQSDRFIEKFTILRDLSETTMLNNQEAQHRNLLKSAKLLSSGSVSSDVVIEMRKKDEKLKQDFLKLQKEAIEENKRLRIEMQKSSDSNNDIQLIELLNSEENPQ